jgi:hypothetical protein
VSWPPSPGGPAPFLPPPPAPSWNYQPGPLVRREPSTTFPLVLAIVAVPAGVLLMLVLIPALFVLAPVAVIAVPAGAFMLAVTRPRRSGRRPVDNRPAPTRRPTSKTTPLSNYRYKKG